MNMEQRARQLDEIQTLEGLLAYAAQHNETEEAERIRAELARKVDEVQ